MDTAHTFTAGEAVLFEGRPATIVSATEPRANLLGVVDQTLEVEKAPGWRVLIGSRHSSLVPLTA